LSWCRSVTPRECHRYWAIDPIELESVDGPEARALPTMQNWPSPFRHGRTGLPDDSRTERPLTNGPGETNGSALAERLVSSCNRFVAFSGLKRRRAWGSPITSWLGETPPSLGATCSIGQADTCFQTGKLF
jgi:hypothetical protein